MSEQEQNDLQIDSSEWVMIPITIQGTDQGKSSSYSIVKAWGMYESQPYEFQGIIYTIYPASFQHSLIIPDKHFLMSLNGSYFFVPLELMKVMLPEI